MAGVTPTGFVIATYEEIRAELVSAVLGIDPALDTAEEGPLGQILSAFAARESTLWELLRVAFSAYDPKSAPSFLLPAIGVLRGLGRIPARASEATCTLTLAAAITVPAGSKISPVGQPGQTWTLAAAVTSTSAGTYPGLFVRDVTGPVAAAAGSLTNIVTPVSGWSAVTNAADAAVGRDEETEEQYRARLVAPNTEPGPTLDGLRAAILEVAGIIDVSILENTSAFVDGNGVPPHSYEPVINAGSFSSSALAQAIWDNDPSGRGNVGVTGGTAIDALGNPVPGNWTVATQVPIWLSPTVVVNPARFPVDGVDRVKARLVAFLETGKIGATLRELDARACLLESNGGVPGVIDVTAIGLRLVVAPITSSNLTMGVRQVADFDTTRISVTVA